MDIDDVAHEVDAPHCRPSKRQRWVGQQVNMGMRIGNRSFRLGRKDEAELPMLALLTIQRVVEARLIELVHVRAYSMPRSIASTSRRGNSGSPISTVLPVGN